MRRILICAMLAPLMLVASGNAQDKPVQVDANKLVGKWKVTKGKAWITFLELNADGKLNLTADVKGKTYDVPGNYKLDGNKLLMKMVIENQKSDESLTILKLSDDAMTTTAANGRELTFERVKAKKVEPVQVDAKKLVGKWKGTDEESKAANTFAEFKADGKVTLTGDFKGKTYETPGTYKLDGNKLLMKIKIGNEETDEEVTILKLTDTELATTEKNGKKSKFERVKAKKSDK